MICCIEPTKAGCPLAHRVDVFFRYTKLDMARAWVRAAKPDQSLLR